MKNLSHAARLTLLALPLSGLIGGLAGAQERTPARSNTAPSRSTLAPTRSGTTPARSNAAPAADLPLPAAGGVSPAGGSLSQDRSATAFAASDVQQVSAETSPELRAENCMVKLIQNVRVPAEVEGRITAMKVVEGSNVEQGDVLAVIDDTQAQLTLELKQAEEREAELNALNDINIRDAINSERSANAEAEAYKELRREGATPYWEMEKKILEADRAKLRIELAESEQKIAKVQYLAKKTERQLAEHDLTRRHVVAPFGGYIESRIAQLGEWVQPGSPILQLVRLDMLRIEGDIDALSYPGQVTVGTPAKVWIYANADGKADRAQAIQLDAKIGFVSSEIDLNNRYRIWVEVKNERRGDNWVIKPGMEADVTVIPGGTAN